MPDPFSRGEAFDKHRLAEAELRNSFDACFKTNAGRAVLRDLIEKYDPIRHMPATSPDAAMYAEGTRLVMMYLRDMTGDLYHEMAAQVDAADR